MSLQVLHFSSTTDQFADAGSRKKIHFTQTITSSQDPGQGHQNHQLALILSPNDGTLYDGSMTFTSSEPGYVGNPWTEILSMDIFNYAKN